MMRSPFEWNPQSKVFIGGLKSTCDKAEIEDLFSDFGRVLKVWTAQRPPGFGFVQMVHADDAAAAVRALHGSRLNGFRITVEMVSLRKSNYKIERRSPRQIYKREFSSLRSNSSSRSWSSQRDIRLTSRNENRGRSIVRSPVQWNQGAKKVYIGGLRRDAQESEIKDIFTDFGKVLKVWIAQRPAGFGFVLMSCHDEALDAVRSLNGCKMCGNRVTVAMAKNDSTFRGRHTTRAHDRDSFSGRRRGRGMRRDSIESSSIASRSSSE